MALIKRQAKIPLPQSPLLTLPESLSSTTGDPWPPLGKLLALTCRVTGHCRCLITIFSFRPPNLGGPAAGPATASSGRTQRSQRQKLQQQVSHEKPAGPCGTWASLHVAAWQLCHHGIALVELCAWAQHPSSNVGARGSSSCKQGSVPGVSLVLAWPGLLPCLQCPGCCPWPPCDCFGCCAWECCLAGAASQ